MHARTMPNQAASKQRGKQQPAKMISQPPDSSIRQQLAGRHSPRTFAGSGRA